MRTTAFVHARVIDGKGGLIENGTLLVQGTKLVAVGGAEQVAVPAGAAVIDLTGKTVMPGMMDAHVHLETSASNNVPAEVASMDLPHRTLKAYCNAMDTIRSGFTAVRDVADISDCVVAVRDLINSGLLKGPRILASGKAINQTGGHASMSTEYLWAKPDTGGSAHCVDGEAECRRAVRIEIAHGVDLIKIYVTSGMYDPFLGRPRDEFSEAEIAALCSEAANAGKRVAAHCHTAKSAKYCLENGAISIEHGMMINEETLDLLKEKDAYWVLTTGVYQLMADGESRGISASAARNSRSALVNQKAMFQKAMEKGVNIGIGTDCGGVLLNHGESALELVLLNRWGMSAMDCIKSATSGNARLLGIDHLTGSLESGKEADLVVVDGNPLDDLTLLQDQSKIALVMKGGDIFKDILA